MAMQEWFLTPFANIAVSLIFALTILGFLAGALWIRKAPGAITEKESRVSRNLLHKISFPILLILVPIVLGVSIIFILFPFERPSILILRSSSLPFTSNGHSEWDVEWKKEMNDYIKQGEKVRVLNAGEISDIILRDLSKLQKPFWLRDEETEQIISEHIFAGYESNYKRLGVEDLEKIALNKSFMGQLPRWVIETVEKAVLKRLVTRRNVSTVFIQVGQRQTSSGHAWMGLNNYLNANGAVEKNSIRVLLQDEVNDQVLLTNPPLVFAENNDFLNVEANFKIPANFCDNGTNCIDLSLSITNEVAGNNSLSCPTVITSQSKDTFSTVNAVCNNDGTYDFNELTTVVVGFNTQAFQVTVEGKEELHLYIDSEVANKQDIISTIAFLIDDGHCNNLSNTTNPTDVSTNWHLHNRINTNSIKLTDIKDNKNIVIEYKNNEFWIYPQVILTPELHPELDKLKARSKNFEMNDPNLAFGTILSTTDSAKPQTYSLDMLSLIQSPSTFKYIEGEMGRSMVLAKVLDKTLINPGDINPEKIIPIVQTFPSLFDEKISLLTHIGLNLENETLLLQKEANSGNCFPNGTIDSELFFSFWTTLFELGFSAIPRVKPINADFVDDNQGSGYILTDAQIAVDRSNRFASPFTYTVLVLALYSILMTISVSKRPSKGRD